MRSLALILGGTGGIGYACAEQFALNGYDIVVVYRGRRSKEADNKLKIENIESLGVNVTIVKGNICTQECLDKVVNLLKNRQLAVFVHAIADGNIGAIFDTERKLNQDSFIYTFNSMCVSFVTWTQVLIANGIIASGCKIIGFSSQGFFRYIPQYAAVALAKAGLETLCLYMSEELKKSNITVIVVRTSMIDTNAVRVFDNYEKLKMISETENINHRLMKPSEVAIYVMKLVSNENQSNGCIVDICK